MNYLSLNRLSQKNFNLINYVGATVSTMELSVPLMQEHVSCIPATRIMPSGVCEMCHLHITGVPYTTALLHEKIRKLRNRVLDAIDRHDSLLSVPHIGALGPLHDVYYVCRHCFFLLRQKGKQHYLMHNYVPLHSP